MTVQGILTQAAGYVQRATTYVIEGAKTAYVAFKTAVNPTEGPMKGIELERTGLPTSEDNAVPVLAQASTVMQAMMNDAENEAYVTEFFSSYITPETNVVATSFNASMALGGFEEAYEKMAVA